MKRAKKAISFRKNDLMAWNFIIFLTLSFILLVVVLSATNQISFDLRTRANNPCPTPVLPRAEDCPGGWTLKRDPNSPLACVAFFCEAKAK